jgi:hypothetical protein
MQDALLAATASAEADALVTNDGDLGMKVKARNLPCELWSLEDFQHFVEDCT